MGGKGKRVSTVKTRIISSLWEPVSFLQFQAPVQFVTYSHVSSSYIVMTIHGEPMSLVAMTQGKQLYSMDWVTRKCIRFKCPCYCSLKWPKCQESGVGGGKGYIYIWNQSHDKHLWERDRHVRQQEENLSIWFAAYMCLFIILFTYPFV